MILLLWLLLNWLEWRLHSWYEFGLVHHVHDLNLLRLGREDRVDRGFEEPGMRNLSVMVDAESLEQPVDLHDDV